MFSRSYEGVGLRLVIQQDLEEDVLMGRRGDCSPHLFPGPSSQTVGWNVAAKVRSECCLPTQDSGLRWRPYGLRVGRGIWTRQRHREMKGKSSQIGKVYLEEVLVVITCSWN